jgi:hypothetical protein
VIATILACVRFRKDAFGLYIMAAYQLDLVRQSGGTIARSLADSFGGILPGHAPAFTPRSWSARCSRPGCSAGSWSKSCNRQPLLTSPDFFQTVHRDVHPRAPACRAGAVSSHFSQASRGRAGPPDGSSTISQLLLADRPFGRREGRDPDVAADRSS